jgi:hypothetical protein
MMTAMRSAVGAALGVLLLAAGPARAEDPPAGEHHTHHSHHSHHSHHKDKDKHKAPPAERDATTPTETMPAAPAPASTTPPATPAPEPATIAPATTAPAATPAPAPSSPTQPQADLHKSQSTDRPWVKGVSQAEQSAAVALFHEGNSLLKESLFVQAAAKYREALRHWDHPGIHYNLALALLNLDQPVEVYTHLEEAVKYGPLPLDIDKFDHATRYRALIEKELARVDVTCAQKGALVTMDGQKLFLAPGHYEALVRAGQHTMVATKSGFVTVEKSPTLPPGEKTTIDLHLFTAEQLTRYKRRWSQAVPVAVLVTGIVVAGAGGIMHWQANEQFKQFDSGIVMCSVGSPNGGCTPNGSLAGKRTTGNALQASAFTAYGLGAAVVAVGGVLMYLNRGRPYHVEGDVTGPVSVAPVVGPGAAGLMATVRY